MVHEYGIKVFFKESFRDFTFKLIESKVEILKARQTKNNIREFTRKAIVT